MSFLFKCPQCNMELQAEDEWAGMETVCPNCSKNIVISKKAQEEQSSPSISLQPSNSTKTSAPEISESKNHIATKFTFICPACGTSSKLDLEQEGHEYECPACCEKSIAKPAIEKQCPYCGEMIKLQAKICRFCKKSMEIDKSSPTSSTLKSSTHPQLIPATSNTIAIKELDTLFFWWWLSLALTIPTFGIGGIASAVFFCMLFYKYWSLVQTETSSMTPGKAVGFLCIPFFGLYWMFISFWGLGKIFNALTDLGKQKLEMMPLITCICGAAAPLAWGLMIIGANTVFIIGVFFTLVYLGAIIGGLVFYIITMINFHNAAKIIIQRQ